ncbi:MAG: carbamoyl transferase [Magnetococcales bacterium]|nr:carbamoyl transferase [Magnetococcales bacterium]MBF0630166.1 carbamoyl transferase [Magnetococcales bacterium]
MIILGVNEGHNASAALLVDGKLIAAISEDRPTRQTTRSGFPFKAIEECLALGGITLAEIDRVALSTLHLPPKYFWIPRESFSIRDFWREQNEFWKPRLFEGKRPVYMDVFKDRMDPSRFIYDPSLIKDEDDCVGMLEARLRHHERFFGLPRERISVHDHHTCHAWYAYMVHPRRLDQDLLVFAADGAGDGVNGSVWHGVRGQPLQALHRTNQCNIGRIYRYVTLLLGMKQFEHAFKTMGLAPYGNPKYGQLAYEVFAETLQVDGLGFSYRIKPKDHFFHFKERLEGLRFDGIAWGIQKRTEELLSEWVGNGVAATGCGNVVMTGGVAMNIKANKVVWERPDVHSLFVPPGSGDESLSIGAACKVAVDFASVPGETISECLPMTSVYLGPSFHDDEIRKRLDRTSGLDGCTIETVQLPRIAQLLAAGHVLGRFSGRAEFGQRALGNRSILADPRPREVVRTINEMIKQRDFWMPFASSVLAERKDDYVINPKNLQGDYMTLAFDSTPEGQRDMIGALHPYDKTSRPHVVERDANPGYHALISAFARETGVGALLNTSFNLHGEPIVHTPEDAISTFLRSGLDHLLLGEWLVSKPGKS